MFFLVPFSLSSLHTIKAKQGEVLVLNQNFAHIKTLNPKIWHYDTSRAYNNELETYTGLGQGNVYIKNGMLVIEAKKSASGKITSGRLTTIPSYKYCHIEVVAKVPTGRGTWPAIWMLGNSIRQKGSAFRGWPLCGEIDIMENVGFDPAAFHFTLHNQLDNGNNNTGITFTKRVAHATDRFHTFGMYWSKSAITFTMDGKKVVTRKRIPGGEGHWPFDKPFYLILNLAIGGDWGGAKGISPNLFPAKLEIKSVKIWEPASIAK